MMRAVLAIRLLLPERHAEMREEDLGVLVRPRRRDDVDVHSADLVHLVEHDLLEYDLLSGAECVVAPTVESLRRHALEVAYPWKRDADEAVQTRTSARPATS